MGAYAIRNDKPIITRKPLKGRKPDAAYKRKIEFMDNHNFSFSLNEDKSELRVDIKEK